MVPIGIQIYVRWCVVTSGRCSAVNLEAKLRFDKYFARKKSDAPSSEQLLSTALKERKDRVEECKLNPVLCSLFRNGRIPSHIRCDLDYWSIQLLTGHGSFGLYLKNIKARVTGNCSRCAVRQDNRHSLFDCCPSIGAAICKLVLFCLAFLRERSRHYCKSKPSATLRHFGYWARSPI